MVRTYHDVSVGKTHCAAMNSHQRAINRGTFQTKGNIECFPESSRLRLTNPQRILKARPFLFRLGDGERAVLGRGGDRARPFAQNLALL